MALASPETTIADLRRWLGQMEALGRISAGVLPFDIPEVDAHVPGGGLALGHFHEVIEGGAAREYAGLATLFAAGIAARLTGPVLWCLRGRDLFAPALARIGLHHNRVIYCETWKDGDVLPAMEEGLKCKGLAAVVGEVKRLSQNASRRLQLAAGQSGVTALVIRRWHNKNDKSRAGEPNAATTRWRVSPHPSPSRAFDGLDRQHWCVELLRARGGEPHSWVLEACDATGHLALPAALANGSAAAGERRHAATG